MGSSGCGKSLSQMWTKVVGIMFCMCNRSEDACGVAMHGGMGSGSVFFPVLKGSSVSVEASDIWLEIVMSR